MRDAKRPANKQQLIQNDNTELYCDILIDI